MNLSSVFSISSLNSPSKMEGFGEILDKAQQGDSGAFTEIYNLYFKKIYSFIYYRVSHKETAEDLAEEVFLKAFSKLSSISQSGAFDGWLYQIARNLVVDYYRAKHTTVPLEEIENSLEYESGIIDLVNLNQQQKILLKLLKHLTSEQQIVIKLKFFEDLTNSEIAQALQKNEGTIRVIQHRAILKLQELIKQLGNY